MATRRRIRRKPPVEEYEEDVVEEEELEDDDLEEEDDDLEEEDDEPPPAPKATPKKVKPPVKKKTAPKQTRDNVEESAEVLTEAIEVKKVDTIVAEGVLTGLLDAMDKGQSIIITKLADHGKWQLSSGTAAVAAGPKLRGQEYWNEVLTEDYQEWHEDWKNLTYADKKKKAKSLKVKWEEHDDERIDNIRISAAVLSHLGIEKYNDDYQTRSARSRLRGK